MQMFVKECGPMGTGSNMFRSALRASDGTVYIGTYGPAPAIIWRYTKDERLEKVAEVEEYQLDCMVEAPNGKIYIGTAYSGLVYELDPKSGTVRSLGSPPIDSTPWIFTMVCTSKGEIYGAKGVGLFRLDWETGTFTVLGNVPGNHHTSGPNASEPIVRSLEERSDGLIWGDTNRWIFLFDPQTHGVKLVADIGVYEKGCYAVLHGEGHSPVNDLYFVVMTRYSGMKIETPLNRLDAQTHEITPITDVEMDGRESFCGWQKVNGENVFLMSSIRDYGSELIAYSPRQQKVIHRWRNISSDHQLGYVRNSGDRLLFFAQGRSALLEAPYGDDSIIRLAENPVAAECRCLAISEQSTLGTDTYDCGYVFTRAADSSEFWDHGKVDMDDHRCNYGPAVFSKDGRYFFANHGEGVRALWMTDTISGRHTRLMGPATDLVCAGRNWIAVKIGDCPQIYRFDSSECWIDEWRAKESELILFDLAQQKLQKTDLTLGEICQVPKKDGYIFALRNNELNVLSLDRMKIAAACGFEGQIRRICASSNECECYILDAEYRLYQCVWRGNSLDVKYCCSDFSLNSRGFFTLPESGCVVGLSDESYVCYDGRELIQGTLPSLLDGAGPAVSVEKDVFYFAGKTLKEYSIKAVCRE